MPTDDDSLAAIVSVHDVRVGQLDRIGDYEDFMFVFDPGWLSMPSPPLLGQLFEDRKPKAIRTSGLPCWFDHLLPQGPSRRLFQRWLELDERDNDSFQLLLGLGMDLPGAVTLSPATPRLFGPGGYAAPRPEPPKGPGFSLAGAQNKLSVRDGDKGLVVPARGERGDFIAKFHDPRFGNLPRLEWSTTQWARLAGIRTHEAQLTRHDGFVSLPEGLDVGEGDVFLAKRFDRLPSGRVHVEDFGQILDVPASYQYDKSYEMVCEALFWLAPQDIQEYVERLAFMIACGNADAHLKNWGIVYPDRRRAALSPAYDLIATVAVQPRDSKLALSLGGKREFRALDLSDFESLATRVDIDVRELQRWVCDAIQRTVQVWHDEMTHLELTTLQREHIGAHMAHTPIIRDQ